jgi:hypothetical protein
MPQVKQSAAPVPHRTTRNGGRARDSAKFVAAFAKCFPNGIVHLVGRERPQADPCSVGFANSEHIIDRIRTKSEPVAACAATVLDEVT